MASQRLLRLNASVQRALSEIIQNEVRDPRIPEICSVSKVEITNDLMHAKVYISVLADEAVQQQALDAIKHASGFIAHELGSRVRMRRVPQLHILLDTSIAYATHINRVIDDLEAHHE